MPKKKIAHKPNANAEASAENVDFEAALSRLESIVLKLEQGGLPLDEALEQYSSAVQLIKTCHQRLESAEQRIELLSGMDSQGNPITEPWQDSLAEEEEPSAKRKPRRPKRSSPAKRVADDEGLF